ncbi:MAG TPA: hypothetical protein VIH40_04105 [Xanthobacteraceae bacterium]
MRVPEELKRMLGLLDCNVEHLVAFPEALVSRAVRESSSAERKVVKVFLDELLSRNPSYQELEKVWWSGPIEIIFKDEEYLRNFFRLMRDQLDKPT